MGAEAAHDPDVFVNEVQRAKDKRAKAKAARDAKKVAEGTSAPKKSKKNAAKAMKKKVMKKKSKKAVKTIKTAKERRKSSKRRRRLARSEGDGEKQRASLWQIMRYISTTTGKTRSRFWASSFTTRRKPWPTPPDSKHSFGQFLVSERFKARSFFFAARSSIPCFTPKIPC